MPPPLEKEELDQHIKHAKTRNWNAEPGNEELTDYSHAANVFAYCAEQLSQNVALLLGNLREETRREVVRSLKFTTGIVGRTAELEGGIKASGYHKFDTDEGNQIDMFLKEVGYMKG